MTVQRPRTEADATIARLTAVIERQQREIEQLRRAQARRGMLQLAEGVLIEQLRCRPTEAAEHLRRLAERAGVGLVELAADLLGQPAPAEDPGERVRLGLAEAGAQTARDGSELASVLLNEALGEAGAVAVAVWELCADGALELSGHAGFEALEASRWSRIPPHLDCLPQRVVRGGRPLWLPHTEGIDPLFGHWPAGARAVLPLSGAKGLVGVMEVVWPSPRAGFSAALRRELASLAGVSARTVDLHLALGEGLRPAKTEAALIGSGLLARPLRDEAGTVVDLEITHVGEHLEDPAGRPPREIIGRALTQAYPWLGASEAFERAVEVLNTGAPCRLDGVPCAAQSGEGVTPALANVRILRFFDGVLIDWRLEHDAARLTALLQHIQRLGYIGGWEENLVSGETSWTAGTFELFGLPPSATPVDGLALRDYVHPADLDNLSVFQNTLRHGQEAVATFRLARADGTIRQVRAHGEPVFAGGALVALRGVYQDISAQYQSQVALAATQDRLADTEEEVRQQHRIARQLQRVILPPSVRPVRVDGLEIAVRYRPAEKEHKVGGDWYDAVMLADGRVLLVIGDVAGHGIPAATGMVALRNMLRGLTTTGAGPGRLLSWLNATAFQLAPGTTGTVVCGLYEPETRRLRWARAGHLPPLLMRDGAAEFLPLPQGVLLGAVPDAEFEETETRLREDDTLVLYTDGLIERRSVLIDDSLDRLAQCAAGIEGDVERVTDELLHHASAEGDDDTCLIVIRLGAPGLTYAATKNARRVSSGG